VTKPIDKASPKLFVAAALGTSLPTVTLRIYQPDPLFNYLTVTLTIVVSSSRTRRELGLPARPCSSRTLRSRSATRSREEGLPTAPRRPGPSARGRAEPSTAPGSPLAITSHGYSGTREGVRAGSGSV
jgi:hypothetical protein